MNFPDLFWGERRSRFFGCLWEPNHSDSFLVSIDLMHVQSYTNVWGDAMVGADLPRQGCVWRHQQLPSDPHPVCAGSISQQRRHMAELGSA